MLRFKLEHGDDIDQGKPAAGSRTDFGGGQASRTPSRRNYPHWSFEDASGGDHPRSTCGGAEAFWRKPRPGVGREAGRDTGFERNQAVRAAKLFHSVDSVDDFVLAQRLDRARSEIAAPAKLRVLIEVHIAKEEAKSGADTEELPLLAEQIAGLPMLELAGLMCIPPFAENAEEARPHFRRLRELRDGLAQRLGPSLAVLSMGMSHDFEVAIEEGATEVRVGTALFGTRGTVLVGQ